MKEISILINERKYRIMGEESQESHIQKLATKLNQYLNKLNLSEKQMVGSDAFLMIALNLINEIEELKQKQVYTETSSTSILQDDNFIQNLHILVEEIEASVSKIEEAMGK